MDCLVMNQTHQMMLTGKEASVIEVASGSKLNASLPSARCRGDDNGVEAMNIFRISKLPSDSEHTSQNVKCNPSWVTSSSPVVISSLQTQSVSLGRRI